MRIDLEIDEVGLWLPAKIGDHAVRALIDTGADVSHVEREIAQRIGLERDPLGVGVYPSGVRTVAYGGNVTLTLEGGSTINGVRFYEEPRKDMHHYGMLLGRDVLRHGVLIYDGPRGEAFLYL